MQGAGATFNLAGFSTTIGSLSGAGAIALGGATLTVGGDGTSTSFGGQFTNAGAFVKAGAGVLTLTGANTYSGLTTVSAGTLAITNANALGSTAAGTVVASGATLSLVTDAAAQPSSFFFFANEPLTLAGAGVGGLGALRSDAGSAGGTNSWGGPITLAADARINSDRGTLSLGAISGAGTTLTLGGAGNLAVSRAIALGAGGLVKDGAGSLSLGGVNTYTGLTTVAGGSLFNFGAIAGRVANGASFSNVAGAVVTGGLSNLAGTALSDGTINGGVTNAAGASFGSAGIVTGGLVNSGTARLANRVEGTIANDAGSITLIGALAAPGAFVQAAGARFDLAGFQAQLGSLAGAGAVTLGGANLFVGGNGGSTAFAGVISGAGALVKEGAGVFTLSGANTFAGLAQVNAGTLALAGGRALADGVAVNVASGATLRLDASQRIGSLAGAGAIALGANTLTIGEGTNAAFPGAFAAAAEPGALAGASAAPSAAGLATSEGRATTASNTAGTAILAEDRAAPATSPDGAPAATAANTAGTATLAGAPAPSAAGPAATAANTAGTATLADAPAPPPASAAGGTLKRGAPVAADGSTAQGPGTAGADTAGTATLADAPAAPGAGGTLVRGAPLAAGAITLERGAPLAAGADVTLERGTPIAAAAADTLERGVPIAAAAAGVPTVRDAPSNTAATATLADAPAAAGPTLPTTLPTTLTLVASDPPAVAAGANAPTPAASAATGGGSSVSFSGVISGTGALVKTGSGYQGLSGANVYTGGTTILGGVLALETGGSILGNVVVTGPGLFAFNRTDAFTFAGVISGTGGLVQAGTGTTRLTGLNTFTGGTAVQSGRLIAGAANLPGDVAILAPGTLQFDQTANATWAGRLAGAGALEKTGAGRLLMTGNSNGFTGATRVLGGELSVNGQLAFSRVTVASGAILSGIGVVGGIDAQAGSTIAPGNSPGVLSVAGDVTFRTGSAYAAEIVIGTAGDLLYATGSARLAGTLALSLSAQPNAFDQRYVILQADRGRTGTFDAVTGFSGLPAAILGLVEYDATRVLVVFRPRAFAPLLPAGSTPNARAAAAAFDAATATAGFDANPFFPLYSRSTADIAAALPTFSGEAYAAAARVGLEDERHVRAAALGRLRSAEGDGVWLRVLGARGEIDGDGNAGAVDRGLGGAVLGADAGDLAPDWGGDLRAGAFAYYLASDMDVASRGANADLERVGGGVYAAWTGESAAIRIGASAGRLTGEMRRAIDAGGVRDFARGRMEGTTAQAFLEISAAFALDGGLTLEPFAAADATRLSLDATTELGGPSRLSLAERDYDVAGASLGLRARSRTDLGDGWTMDLSGAAAARVALGDREIGAAAALAAAPGAFGEAFTVPLDSAAAQVDLDARFATEGGLSIGLSYDGLIGSRQSDHAGRLDVSLRF